ncbi:MAG: hypothetical protein U9N76_01585 [Candidatus Marinimicrobia bacterium]|nr:hypothetical protein [Candidatus Neomarinimicrobiota bacterium]
MKPKKILKELETIITENEIDIVHGNGAFSGGFCLLNNLPVVVINKRIPVEEKSTVLVEIIHEKELNYTDCNKSVKEFIDRFK